MPSKAKKPAKPVTEAPHAGSAWRPHIETEPEFNPFASTGTGGDARTQFGGESTEPLVVSDASEDTAPLQGSKDLSDADSLQDIVAAAAEAPRPAAPHRRRARRSSATRKSRVAKTRRATARRATKGKRRPAAKASRSAARAKGAPRVRRALAKTRRRRGAPGAKRRR